MTDKRKLTDTEKRLNRLHERFERTLDEQSFTEWFETRQRYLLTVEGAGVFRAEAVEALRSARFYTSASGVYEDGYAHALSLLLNANLLDSLVAARVVAGEIEVDTAV